MDVNCKLRLNEFTFLEQIRNNSYQLMRPFFFSSLIEIERKGELGINIDKDYIEYFYYIYWIEYLSVIRKNIDRIIEIRGCITQEELNNILTQYQVYCMLEKFKCFKIDKFKQILNLFLENINYCDSEITYVWGDEYDCMQTIPDTMFIWGDEYSCVIDLPNNYLLLENGNYILLEEGSPIYLEG